jgi:hypothetical protein
MIYEINSVDVDYCTSNGCYCICVSNDLITTLISSVEKINGIQILGEYQHTEINELMMLDKWKKICEDCI